VRRRLPLILLAVAAAAGGIGAGRVPRAAGVRILRIVYRADRGVLRHAYVVLPRWYGPRHDPPVPLVISPHGRDATAADNVGIWRSFPGTGSFAVVNPEGQGRRLTLASWGAPSQIRDLTRMPTIVTQALPWLRIDRRRIYAIGDSMGGQEALLLAARAPRLLAGVAAFDPIADLSLRYYALARLGKAEQQALVREVGGTPSARPNAYAVRSPLHWVARLAESGLPIELWWSKRDRQIRSSGLQAGRLFWRILARNPHARVAAFVGRWSHGTGVRRHLREALELLGLLPHRATREPRWGHITGVGS
jgi:pimeloyl-ACP methyl ester carboxylesterase